MQMYRAARNYGVIQNKADVLARIAKINGAVPQRMGQSVYGAPVPFSSQMV